VLVKSPAELVVGTLRQLDLAPADTVPFAVRDGGHGTEPDVAAQREGLAGRRGVDQHQHLLARKQFLDRVAREDAPGHGAQEPVRMAAAPRAALASRGRGRRQ
jgi:hypothetical protein